jgi:hypothetical protein
MRLSEEVDRRRRRLRIATLLLGTAVLLLGLGTLIDPLLQVVSWLERQA